MTSPAVCECMERRPPRRRTLVAVPMLVALEVADGEVVRVHVRPSTSAPVVIYPSDDATHDARALELAGRPWPFNFELLPPWLDWEGS
jgi:hypothetical protein